MAVGANRTMGVEQIRSLHSAGVADYNAGHPRAAILKFRRALAALERVDTGDGDLRNLLAARITISLALSESEVFGPVRGTDTLDYAATLVRRPGATTAAVHLHSQMGILQLRRGDVESALREIGHAVDLIEHAEPREACGLLLTRGSVYMSRGGLRQARVDLLEAIDRARDGAFLVEEFKATHNLGYLEFLCGNFALALQNMDRALELNPGVSVGIALLDRARVLLEVGLYRDSDDSLIEARELFGTERLWQDVGEVELARAECALLDGEFEGARRLAGSARVRFKRRGNERWRRMAELVLLQADLEAGRPGLRLAPHALRLANEFAKEGVAVQARTARLLAAECYLQAGRLELAEAAASQADDLRPDDPISARLHARLVRARLARTSGRRTDARKEIRSGLSELSRYQAQFGGIDLQTASAVHGRKLAELNLEIALDGGKPSDVLSAVEAGRAVSSRLTSVKAPDDETAAELLAELRQVSEELRTIETDPAASGEAATKRRRIREIQRALRERAWQFEGAGEARKPATPTSIGQTLGEQDANLVCFFETEGQLHAVVWGERLARIAALGDAGPVSEAIKRIRADLDVLANGLLPGAMLTAVSGSLKRSLDRLDAALIRPLDLRDERVVLVPTGLLATVPWTLLPSLSGRPVVVAPSASAWLAATDATTTPGGDVLAIAGPDLVRAADEVKAVGKRWRAARVVHGSKATRDQLAQGITSARIVHVAAHGEHQMDNPLFSSIRLADAPLYAWELDQHAHAAEHVVLSACELGQATIRPGDEALGLTSVLLHLGTRSVVSGVARVHDDVAADVMARYHRDLAKGIDSAQALADAVAAETQYPAPFVCFGSAWKAI